MSTSGAPAVRLPGVAPALIYQDIMTIIKYNSTLTYEVSDVSDIILYLRATLETAIMQKPETEEFDEIDNHIRSLSTLGYIFRLTNIYKVPQSTINRQANKLLVEILENLAQCLVRQSIETASVGVIALGNIVASNSSNPDSSGRLYNNDEDNASVCNSDLATDMREEVRRQSQSLFGLIQQSINKGEGTCSPPWPAISEFVYNRWDDGSDKGYIINLHRRNVLLI